MWSDGNNNRVAHSSSFCATAARHQNTSSFELGVSKKYLTKVNYLGPYKLRPQGTPFELSWITEGLWPASPLSWEPLRYQNPQGVICCQSWWKARVKSTRSSLNYCLLRNAKALWVFTLNSRGGKFYFELASLSPTLSLLTGVCGYILHATGSEYFCLCVCLYVLCLCMRMYTCIDLRYHKVS